MQRFKNILFVADGRTDDSPALRRAVGLAESNQARLTLIDVLKPVDAFAEVAAMTGLDLEGQLRQRRLDELATMIGRYQQEGLMSYTMVKFGTPFIEIIRAVHRNAYDLVIKAARPPADIVERVFGSTDLHLLRKCPCPVWIDHPDAASRYRNILAAIDPVDPEDGGCSALVLALGRSLAERESAAMTVLHAWEVFGESLISEGRYKLSATEVAQILSQAEARHGEALVQAIEQAGLEPSTTDRRLINGPAAAVIRRLAEELPADLVVMGTVGRTGIPGFFIGNTAEEVLQTIRASVLAVKPAGFVSPVV